MDVRIMTQGWHLQVVTLSELIGEGDGEIERAVSKVIIVVLVLVDSFH